MTSAHFKSDLFVAEVERELELERIEDEDASNNGKKNVVLRIVLSIISQCCPYWFNKRGVD